MPRTHKNKSALFRFLSTKNPTNLLKNDFEVEIDIVSVTLGNSAGAPIATIRFNEITRKKGEKIAFSNKAKIVTLSYDYQPGTLTTEKERIKKGRFLTPKRADSYSQSSARSSKNSACSTA